MIWRFPKLSRLFCCILVVALGIVITGRITHGFHSVVPKSTTTTTVHLPLSSPRQFVMLQPYLQHSQLLQQRRRRNSMYGFLHRNRRLYDSTLSSASFDTLPADESSSSSASASAFDVVVEEQQHQSDDDDDSNNDVVTLRSVTFSNLPKDQEPNLLCELLMEYGACATWITDADRYTQNEEPIFHEPPIFSNNHSSTTLDDMLSIPWITPIWNQCNVTALFPASIHLSTTISAVRDIYTDIVVTNIAEVEEENNMESEDNSLDDPRVRDSNVQEQELLLQSYSIATIPQNKDWVLSVQQSWHPIIINDCFLLRFPWHTDENVTTAIQQHYNYCNDNTNSTNDITQSDNYDNEYLEQQQLLIQQMKHQLIPILLQGGIAFGTGEHATTQLCLQWLHDIVTRTLLSQEENEETSQQQQQQQSMIRVLDYGTGSGILGIAACAIGQKQERKCRRTMVSTTNDTTNKNNINTDIPLVTAIGIDIDIDACRIANDNAMLNGNVSMQSYLPPLPTNNDDDESQSLLMKAHYNYQQQQQQQSATSNPNTGGGSTDDIIISDPTVVLAEQSFDICVANILAGPSIVLASTLYSYLRPGSYIGMSGILSHQSDMVIQAYYNVGFDNVHVHDTLNGWVFITGRRPLIVEL